MTNRRTTALLVGATATIGALAVATTADASGPETALGAICQQVNDGTWDPENLECTFDPEPTLSTHVQLTICAHALDGLLSLRASPGLPGSPGGLVGWQCHPDAV